MQNFSMAFKRVRSPMEITLLGQQYNVGEKPTVMRFTFTLLIAMQGHHKNSKNKPETKHSK